MQVSPVSNTRVSFGSKALSAEQLRKIAKVDARAKKLNRNICEWRAVIKVTDKEQEPGFHNFCLKKILRRVGLMKTLNQTRRNIKKGLL